MPAHASKGNWYLTDPKPNRVDDLIHGGPLKLGPQQLEPLEGVRMETNPPLIEAGKHPTSNWGEKSASAGRGGKPAASGGLVDLPSEREGAGNGDWYAQSLQGTGREAGKPQGPPYPIRTAQVRQEAIGQIYDCVAGKDPPPSNVASEAL